MNTAQRQQMVAEMAALMRKGILPRNHPALSESANRTAREHALRTLTPTELAALRKALNAQRQIVESAPTKTEDEIVRELAALSGDQLMKVTERMTSPRNPRPAPVEERTQTPARPPLLTEEQLHNVEGGVLAYLIEKSVPVKPEGTSPFNRMGQ